MMKKPFEDSRNRIRWAKRDLTNFKNSRRKFLQKNPHIAVTEMDDKGVYELHKIKLRRPLPDTLNNRTVSVLENLRAALDLVATSSGTLVDPNVEEIHFPFSAREADFKSRLNSACKNLPEDIRSLFATFKPYQGGDDVLWAMNELCKGSKHRVIAAFGIVNGPISYQRFRLSGGGYIPGGVWDCDKDELIYAATTPGSNIQYEVQVGFEIAFREIDVIKGKSVLAVLESLIGKVSSIVNATESECRRLGLLCRE